MCTMHALNILEVTVRIKCNLPWIFLDTAAHLTVLTLQCQKRQIVKVDYMLSSLANQYSLLRKSQTMWFCLWSHSESINIDCSCTVNIYPQADPNKFIGFFWYFPTVVCDGALCVFCLYVERGVTALWTEFGQRLSFPQDEQKSKCVCVTRVVHNVCRDPLRGDISWDGDLLSSEGNLKHRKQWWELLIAKADLKVTVIICRYIPHQETPRWQATWSATSSPLWLYGPKINIVYYTLAFTCFFYRQWNINMWPPYHLLWVFWVLSDRAQISQVLQF